MEDELYDQTMEYLRTKHIPEKVTSTRSNFIAKAKKYKINKKQFLTRYGKLVVKASMEQQMFLENHKHSGRIACWERIKKR
jgi:glycerol-3-phosphate responsive antiterminator